MTIKYLSAFIVLYFCISCTESEHNYDSVNFSGENHVEEMHPNWIELGKYLFYDRRLSLNNDRSCGTCHEQAKAFTDGFVRAVGTTDELHPRNTPSLINVGQRTVFSWTDKKISHLEDQLLIPLLGEDPVEMGFGSVIMERLELLNRDPVYRRLLSSLKQKSLTLKTIAKAIVRFEEVLSSRHSPYDLYKQGNESALSSSAKRGMQVFFEKLPCQHCHGGIDFDQPDSLLMSQTVKTARHTWANTGLYNLGGRYPSGREGVFEHTQNIQDIGKYKVPTLRNLVFTAPYYHDGSAANLDDVLYNYNQGGRITYSGPYQGDGREHPNKHPLIFPLNLSRSELSDLKSFLISLSDNLIIQDPFFADPWPREE